MSKEIEGMDEDKAATQSSRETENVHSQLWHAIKRHDKGSINCVLLNLKFPR